MTVKLTAEQQAKLEEARVAVGAARKALALAAQAYLDATKATDDEIEEAVESLQDCLDDDRASESWSGCTDSWFAMVAEQVLDTREFEEEEANDNGNQTEQN